MHETSLVNNSMHRRLSKVTEATLDHRRRKLGVEDELGNVHGVTKPMLVAFGQHRIKSIEDLAGCTTDDLHGWRELRRGRIVRHAGVLSALDVSRTDCETIIINARLAAGWIDQLART
jgi:transcription termination/antitermination protein NusA